MRVIADICMIPIGVGVSLSKYINIAYQELKNAGLGARLHPYGTEIEGEYAKVSSAIEKAMQALHDAGVPRVHVTIKLGSRVDKAQSMQDKLDVIEE